MKTIRITNYGAPGFAVLYNHFREQAPTLPQAVADERIYQLAVAHSLIGEPTMDPGYGFYETSCEEPDVALQSTDPVGSMELRIDYDPHAVPHEKDDPEVEIAVVYGQAIDILLGAFNAQLFADRAPYVDHIRLRVMVAPGRMLEHTYWPNPPITQEQYDALLMKQREPA